jgi:hypothetical protein
LYIDDGNRESQKDLHARGGNNASPQPSDRGTIYEEMELEDKVLCINTISEQSRILVFHQAAQRLFRKDIVQQMKKNIKELDSIDLEEMIQ